MTFKKFEELFLAKYPDGEVIAHGKMGGTESNKKTTVIFKPNGKCYEYYGAYEDVLCRVGIKTISNSRLSSLKATLNTYRTWNENPIELFGIVATYDAEIQRMEAEIADIEANYIVV